MELTVFRCYIRNGKHRHPQCGLPWASGAEVSQRVLCFVTMYDGFGDSF